MISLPLVAPLHMVSVVGAEVLQGEAEDGEEEVEEVADAQEQQQNVERPQALLQLKLEGDFEGESNPDSSHFFYPFFFFMT